MVATNGPSLVASERLKKADLIGFIDLIFAADEVGYMKPQPGFFKGLLEKNEISEASKMLLVGDSIDSDIMGAANFGMDSCLLSKDEVKSPATYQIKALIELKNIL